MTFELALLMRTISESVALLQLGSELMSMAHGAIKGHADDWGLGNKMWPCWCPRAMLIEELFKPEGSASCPVT